MCTFTHQNVQLNLSFSYLFIFIAGVEFGSVIKDSEVRTTCHECLGVPLYFNKL